MITWLLLIQYDKEYNHTHQSQIDTYICVCVYNINISEQVYLIGVMSCSCEQFKTLSGGEMKNEGKGVAEEKTWQEKF